MSSGSGVAVVGSNGFLGSAIVAGMARLGVPSIGFTRQSPALLPSGEASVDLLASGSSVWAASSINPWIAENSPDRIAVDRSAFIHFLDSLDAARSSTRVILLSSGGTVYDPESQPPYREDSPTCPSGAYGQAKVQLEDILLQRRPGSVVLRVANAYGPGQLSAPGQGVIGHWLRAIREGQQLELIGDPATARDYIYVADVVSAVSAVHANSDVPPVVNIGSGAPTTLAEMLNTIRAIAGECEVIARQARRFDVLRTWLDVSTAKKTLGWEPVVELESGLKQTWDWLRANPGS